MVDNALRWKIDSVIRYLDQCNEFNILMMTAIHLVSGQPARGTEIETFTYRNNDRQRSLFYCRGLS